MAEEGAVVAVDLFEVGRGFGNANRLVPNALAGDSGSRARPIARPKSSISRPPAAPIAACSDQKAAGVIFS
jgi:hypothetical protein